MLPERIEKSWLDAASAALAKNAVTFARLPINELVAKDGYLAKLQGEGLHGRSAGR